MMHIHHSQECLTRTAEIEDEQRRWKARWPSYCRSCNGIGGHHDPGVYRYPDGSGEPPSFDPCSCVEEDCRCPRCGMDWWIPLDEDAFFLDSSFDRQLKCTTYSVHMETVALFLFDTEYPCPCCGWNWGHNKDDALPPSPADIGPCECEMEEERRMAEEWRNGNA